MSIKPGDVVNLLSLGPQMTVEDVWEDNARCVWFQTLSENNWELCREVFPCECLEVLQAK
jgi:uncharacterized protein YodC (DUF2158 family)